LGSGGSVGDVREAGGVEDGPSWWWAVGSLPLGMRAFGRLWSRAAGTALVKGGSSGVLGGPLGPIGCQSTLGIGPGAKKPSRTAALMRGRSAIRTFRYTAPPARGAS
jgi:hypothetical protein